MTIFEAARAKQGFPAWYKIIQTADPTIRKTSIISGIRGKANKLIELKENEEGVKDQVRLCIKGQKCQLGKGEQDRVWKCI